MLAGNVIRRDSDWVLCDLDAAAKFGDPVGAKTSTGYCPPELERVRFALVAATRLAGRFGFGALLGIGPIGRGASRRSGSHGRREGA